MSKHETWRTRKYWKRVGGTLIEEYLAVKQSDSQSKRLIDGIIILNGETKISEDRDASLKDKDVIVIQTKRSVLGMSLLGQSYFSKFLISSQKPRSIKLVAICGKNDTLLSSIAASHDIEVVVMKEADS